MNIEQIAAVGNNVRASIWDSVTRKNLGQPAAMVTEGRVVAIEQDPEFLDWEIQILMADGKSKSIMIGADSTDRTIESI